MTVDSDGRPHFSYYSWSDRTLKYAVGDFAVGIRTWPAKEPTSNSVTLVGELTGLGDASEIEVFFEWRSEGAEWNVLAGAALSVPGFVEVELDSLEPDQTYEYRAVASARGIFFNGDTLTFSTMPVQEPEPIVPDYILVTLIVAAVLGGLTAYLLLVRRRRFIREEESRTRPQEERRGVQSSRRDRRDK